MKRDELKKVQLLITNIDTYSHLLKGINLKKEIQSFNTSMYYDYKNNTEKVLNEIIFTDGSSILFDSYENMLNYLKGMSEFVDMIKTEKDEKNNNEW